MATIISAASGNATAGSTWVGGVAPGSGDRAAIAAGHTVTVNSAVTWESFEVAGTGSLAIASGGTLTFSKSSKTASSGGTGGKRIDIAAGGTLACNPGSGVTATLQLGSDGVNYDDSLLYMKGTDDANRATLRKTAGALGTFNIANATGVLPGTSFSASWAHIEGVNSITLTVSVLGHVFALKNSTVHDVSSIFVTYRSGSHFYLDDNWFTHTSSSGNPPLTIHAFDYTNRTLGYSTLKRNRFGIMKVSVLDVTGVAPTNLSGLDSDLNVFEGQTSFSGDVCHKRAFFYLRPAQHVPGSYTLANLPTSGTAYNVDNAYCVGDFSGGGSNCHFFISTGTNTYPVGINDVVMDYVGAFGTDTGDALDLLSANGRTARIHNTLLVPSTPTDGNPPIASGNLWTVVLAADVGRLDINHVSMYTRGNLSGVGLLHASGYSGPDDRVHLKNSLFWGNSTTKDGCISFMDFPSSTVDVLKASSVTDNAMWNAGTWTNKVGGSSTSVKGFKGQDVTAMPTVLDLDASGGPSFVDGTRSFVRWCREMQGHNSGTLATDMAAGLADIKADPELAFTGLKTWVLAGYVPQNALLDAASDGGWIGAVEGVASYRPKIQMQQRLLMGVGL